MIKIQELKKTRYIVWINFDSEGWQPYPAESAEEIVDLIQRWHGSDYLITKSVTLAVVESNND